MKWSAAFALGFGVFLIAGSPVLAQTSDPLSLCVNISDPRARLACYDWAHRNGATSPARADPEKRSLQEFGWRGSDSKIKRISATIEGFSINDMGKFTMVLDNGQIWRQLNDDVGTAKFKDNLASNRVIISHGFWDSYNLKLNSTNAEFRVERVK
jgi:hypothetical protein